MSLTSLQFLIMVLVAAVIYYALPMKIRWVAILCANLYFLYSCNSLVKLAIWFASALMVYLITAFENDRNKKALTTIGVIALALEMILLRHFEIAPTGSSYYSLIYIAYILDTYWGMCAPEKNPLKFLAFAGYFPLLTSGPIVKYDELGKQLTSGNKFEFKNLIWGLERILWGLIKKMIIADRISVFVDTVYNLPYVYNGLYIWLATVFFVIQLYMDFSGCIDIALGVAEIFGVKLPENFDFPFFAETIEEFWRKWHITLGGFLRDYIFYPILKSSLWQKMMKGTKKAFGKKYGKKVPTWLALIIVWFLIGFWHGENANYIFGVGLWFGLIIILSDALEPIFKGLNKLLHINTEAFSWKAFRVVRTWILFGFGLLFFRALGFMNALKILKLSVSTFNPWILFDGSLYNVGLTVADYHILLFFGLIIISAYVAKWIKKKPIREMFGNQNMVFQWLFVLAGIYSVIVYGCYGVGFDSASFIYQGF